MSFPVSLVTTLFLLVRYKKHFRVKIPVLDTTLTMFMVLLPGPDLQLSFLKKSGFHTMKHVLKRLQVC